jgi:hypothetical protein
MGGEYSSPTFTTEKADPPEQHQQGKGKHHVASLAE